MLTIAVDAMGGDHAPKAEVEGAIDAARNLGIKVILVGQQEVVRKELAHYPDSAHLPIEIVDARERITMEDHAARAVRAKRDSSMRICARLVRDGAAQGFLTAGNTGAAMATAKMVQGVVPGVDRPALAMPLPTVVKGSPVVVVDVGANVDCTSDMLAQFAVMGEIYARVVLGRPKPRVGVLSIGEEDHKGNDITRSTSQLLKLLNLNFIGNVEGRDIYSGNVDVIVCDGFIGNVVLKVSEGVADMVKYLLRESLEATVAGKIGALISRSAFGDFKKRMDYSEYGGAPLLGVRGVCIICHGRSNANAIKNAIRVAKEFCEGNVNQRIEDELRVKARPAGK
ncbi:MAG TPA: phosphate acyltransferase PlsX [Bryobacteraceae bacterium]|jgi:glycerol-3-phosphate acyltransferase PlsX|nr:phosphate acyltransferase PlsX [Bryobacteraceae bacterium]